MTIANPAVRYTVDSPVSVGYTLQDSPEMPETMESTELCCVLCCSYTYIPMVKFNL